MIPKPGMLAENAGSTAYQQGVAQDRDVYGRVFQPEALSLRAVGLGLRGSGSNVYEAAASGMATANRRFDSLSSSFDRDVFRSGRGTAEDVTRQKKRLGLARVIAQVEASNRAIRAADQRRTEAQTFGSQFYADSIVGANSMLSRIAGAETDRDVQYRAARQAAISGSLALGGTVTGATLSMI